MKLLVILALILTSQLEAKTCTATLNGALKKEEFIFPLTNVFYPDNTLRPAKWVGAVVAKKFIPPAPIEIECGKPWLMAKFGTFQAMGTLPQFIETFPWDVDRNGLPYPEPEIVMQGFGDSYDYPYPIAFFEGYEDILVNSPLPAGITDICDATNVPLNLVKKNVLIEPEPKAWYNTPYNGSAFKEYKWDPQSAPRGQVVELELENPSVTISCNAHWSYEATFELVYHVPEIAAKECGNGTMKRTLELEGDFFITGENKVHGYMRVKKPTASYTGILRGSFSGSGFTIPMEGKLSTNANGEKFVLLPPLEGGDNLGWTYSFNCLAMGEEVERTVFGTVGVMLGKINDQEKPSIYEPGFLQFDPKGNEDTFNVDWEGQGKITVKRSWKKL
ncbi:MAG TPA: hypothetical protein VNJ08_07025 [Bacteriovoracaceae bacterium]|nr:hypothetical protein [Bacteriovoracaceae bacterium]